MEQNILGKLKGLTKKFKKNSDDIDDILDEDEITGDIDISILDEDEDTIGSDLRSSFENNLNQDPHTDVLEIEDEYDDEESEDDDDLGEVDDDEDLGAVSKFLKSQLPFVYKLMPKNKSSDSDDNDYGNDDEDDDLHDEDDDLDDEPKKKRKLNLVQVAIIVLVVFGVMEFLFPNEEVAKAPELKKIKKVRRQKPKPIEVEDKAEKRKDIPVVVNKDIDENIDENVDEVADNDINTDEALGEPEPEPVAVIDTEPEAILDSPSDNISDSVDDDFSSTETDISVGEEATSEEEGLTGEEAESNEGDLFGDGVIDEVVDSSDSSDITDSILKSLEEKIKESKKKEIFKKASKPTNPPEYDIAGRALVYNCSGKHWACIDSVSFNKCSENFSWNTQSGNSIECYPSEIYDNADDCAAVQQFKIDNISKTDFCGENF